jgi:hypothetical protein
MCNGRYSVVDGAARSRLTNLDRQTLITVLGAIRNLLAVSLMRLPATTRTRIRSRITAVTFGRQ